MLELHINDIFYVAGRGLVMAGKIRSGEVHAGDRVFIKTPSLKVQTKVSGIEVERQIVMKAMAGENVALFIQNLSTEQLQDGIEQLDSSGWSVVDITVEQVPARWWEFWR